MAEAYEYFVRLDPFRRFWQSPGYATRYTRRLLRRVRRHNGIILIGELAGQPAGLLVAEMVPWRAQYSLESRGRYYPAEILELYVSESYRRKGVSRALMEEAERRLRARGCDWVRLEVFAPNRPARAFYRSLGYQPRDLRLAKPLRGSRTRKRGARTGEASLRSWERPPRLHPRPRAVVRAARLGCVTAYRLNTHSRGSRARVVDHEIPRTVSEQEGVVRRGRGARTPDVR
jgi:GNAT superfamily N-acetyltransferase